MPNSRFAAGAEPKATSNFNQVDGTLSIVAAPSSTEKHFPLGRRQTCNKNKIFPSPSLCRTGNCCQSFSFLELPLSPTSHPGCFERPCGRWSYKEGPAQALGWLFSSWLASSNFKQKWLKCARNFTSGVHKNPFLVSFSHLTWRNLERQEEERKEQVKDLHGCGLALALLGKGPRKMFEIQSLASPVFWTTQTLC